MTRMRFPSLVHAAAERETLPRTIKAASKMRRTKSTPMADALWKKQQQFKFKRGITKRGLVSILLLLGLVCMNLFSAPTIIRPELKTTYEILRQQSCLPNPDWIICVLTTPSNGELVCADRCGCYCQHICSVSEERRKLNPFSIKKYRIIPPPQTVHNGKKRLIPRIIHQTSPERITAESHPNTYTLIQNMTKSGWEYKWYSDDDVHTFVKKYLPVEVFEALNATVSGIVWSDLFRLCVLAVEGGVTADTDFSTDVLLDELITPDIGFMIPQDPAANPTCPEAGFTASSPGHPIATETLARVVSFLLNRGTGVEISEQYCPNLLAVQETTLRDALYTGPCAFGITINNMMGKPINSAIRDGFLPIVGVPGKTRILPVPHWSFAPIRHRGCPKSSAPLTFWTDLDEGVFRELHRKTGHYSTKITAAATHQTFGAINLYQDSTPAYETVEFFVNRPNPFQFSRDRLSDRRHSLFRPF